LRRSNPVLARCPLDCFALLAMTLRGLRKPLSSSLRGALRRSNPVLARCPLDCFALLAMTLRGLRKPLSSSLRGALATKQSSPCSLPSGLLRVARNDVEKFAETSEFVVARSPCDEAIQSLPRARTSPQNSRQPFSTTNSTRSAAKRAWVVKSGLPSVSTSVLSTTTTGRPSARSSRTASVASTMAAVTRVDARR
jgi:hypothetical protein